MRISQLQLKYKNEYQFIVYLLVGGLNTLFGYSLYAILLFLHLHYVLALLGATCAGVAFNFMTIGRLVFFNKDNRFFIKFVAVYGILYLLNVMLVKCFMLWPMSAYLAGFFAIFPLALVGFVLNKRFVFNRLVLSGS